MPYLSSSLQPRDAEDGQGSIVVISETFKAGTVALGLLDKFFQSYWPTKFQVSPFLAHLHSYKQCAMIDGIDWAGKGGCLCAGCRAAVFSEFEESEDRESMCESEREERKRERSNRKWREGRRREKRERASVPSSCPSGRPGVYSSTLSRTTEPGTAVLKQVLLIVPPFPKDGCN